MNWKGPVAVLLRLRALTSSPLSWSAWDIRAAKLWPDKPATERIALTTGCSPEAAVAAAAGFRPGIGVSADASADAKSAPGLRAGTGGCHVAPGIEGFFTGSGVSRGSAAITQHLLKSIFLTLF
jgi:hypothetical protein